MENQKNLYKKSYKNKEQEEIIMAVVYAFLADGLEEVECLATADVLIRAGVKVKLVSITGEKRGEGRTWIWHSCRHPAA